MVNAALGLACALAIDPERRRGPARLALAALLALAITLPFLPPNGVILAAGMFRHDQRADLVYFHEDAQASVTIRRLQSQAGPYLSLELNGVNVAGTSPDLYAVQKMQGHLPLLLGSSVESVAHIGFGSGGTAWAVSQHPVQEIRIVEISPEVIAASHRFFSNINHGVLDDPRVQVEINDGRNHLLATSRTYDAVLSDSIHPRYSGNGSLYSLEYFQRLADRLAPGGVASMWLRIGPLCASPGNGVGSHSRTSGL
jgi:predicted membrane-bound spermidine synthase